MQRMMIRRRGARCSGSGAVALNLLRASLTAVPFLATLAPCRAEPTPAIHYAPAENLEHIDVALIDRAEHEIDMAAYVLTDWPILQALTRAADRGVKVRIYLDGTQLAEREPAKVFNDLAETPGVEIRTKHKSNDPMHLKSYQIDGRLLAHRRRELFRVRPQAAG